MHSAPTIFDATGAAQVLAPLLASGGEGQVFPLAGKPQIVVKQYHPEVLQKRGTELRAKTEAMIEMRENFASACLSWPRISVFDDKRQWIGYAMRRAQGRAMNHMAHAVAYRKHFPTLDRIQIAAYMLSLLDAVRALHRAGVYIGDYNFNNVLCTPGSAQVTLIDCDSYQMQHKGRTYLCPVGSPDMTPLEHHGQAFDKVRRTEHSELFSVAIMLFKCLMLGRHPYDIQGGEDPVSNLRAGQFAYGKGNRGIPVGDWYNIWSHMPHRLKEMFILTFTEGAKNPDRRPALDDWHQALSVYLSEMKKGWHEVAVRPTQPKSSNYRGARSQTSA